MSTPIRGPLPIPRAAWTPDLADTVTGDAGSPRRAWLSWSAMSLPIAPLLLFGMLLGPQGLFILTPAALAAIDPALPVALATLGGLLGLMPGLRSPVRRALGTAAATAVITLAFVAAGFAIGAAVSGEQSPVFLWLLPLVLGIAAASSLLVPVAHAEKVLPGLAPTPESEAIVAVIAGGVLLAFVRQSTMLGTVVWMFQACAVVMVVGLAGFLMLRRSVVDAERRVFVVATLLLVGGAADALSFSALLGGLCAGLLWKLGGGLSRESLQRDMLYALPPLVALVLVVAGARTELSTVSLGLAAAYACLRTLGRIASGALTMRSPAVGSMAGLRLLTPGVFGIAFALNAFRALGSDMSIAISVVVLGTILAEVAALLVTRRGEAT